MPTFPLRGPSLPDLLCLAARCRNEIPVNGSEEGGGAGGVKYLAGGLENDRQKLRQIHAGVDLPVDAADLREVQRFSVVDDIQWPILLLQIIGPRCTSRCGGAGACHALESMGHNGRSVQIFFHEDTDRQYRALPRRARAADRVPGSRAPGTGRRSGLVRRHWSLVARDKGRIVYRFAFWSSCGTAARYELAVRGCGSSSPYGRAGTACGGGLSVVIVGAGPAGLFCALR